MKRCLRSLMVMVLLIAGLTTANSVSHAAQEETPAAESRSVSLYPAETGPGEFVTVTVDPGASQDVTLVVGNSGNVSQEIRVYAVPALSADNGGFSVAPYGTEMDQPTSWLEFPEVSLSLEPGSGQEIVLRINVPEDALPGEYVTAVAADQADAFQVEGTEQVTQRVRRPLPVLIVVSGELQPAFEVSEASLEIRGENLIAKFAITNTGNATISPAGEARLQSPEGDVLAVTNIELGSIYSGTQADVYVAWQNTQSLDSYTLEVSFADYEGSGPVEAEFAGVVPVVPQAQAAATPAPQLAFSRAEFSTATDDVPPSVLIFDGEINNPGDPIDDARVSIVTYQNGVEVDRYPIMQAVTIQPGSTPLEARYSLPGGFTEGTYTFEVSIELGSEGTQTVLLTQPIDYEITTGD